MALPAWALDFWTWAYTAPVMLFLLAVVRVVARRPSIFTRRFARRHRLAGLAYLIWLAVGFLDAACQTLAPAPPAAPSVAPSPAAAAAAAAAAHPPAAAFLPRALYDVVLALLGTALTLTAAFDFRQAHAHVKNVASGALEADATVTVSEMLEHAFYQMLNGVQIVFLHALSFVHHPHYRAGLALAATGAPS